MNPVEKLQARGVSSVVHLHCDHFEPFGTDTSGRCIEKEHVQRWIGAVARTPVRPTLFFSSQAYYFEGTSFRRTSRADLDAEILETLFANGLDVHVHIHHEYWTKAGVSPAVCSLRLDELLSLLIPYTTAAALKAGRVFNPQRWAFVHGCWALQASDATICNIADEIAILQARGCVADFSFPAGRAHCNPGWPGPRRVDAVSGPKGYATVEARPGPPNETPERFLVWSAQTPFKAASLDLAAFDSASTADLIAAWLDHSPIVDGTLYIKTHAHSMQAPYWSSVESTTSPLLTVRVDRAFGILQELCNRAGVELRFCSVSEVLKQLERQHVLR